MLSIGSNAAAASSAISSCVQTAKDYQKEGNYSAAINALKACLTDNPTDNDARILLAEVYFLNNKNTEALAEIDILKNNGANLSKANVSFCIANFKRKNYRQATTFGKEVNAKELSVAEQTAFYEAYGQSLFKINLFLEAIQELEKAVALNDNNSALWMSLGDAYTQIENNKRALICYEKAVQGDIKNPAKQILLAEAYYDAGDRIKSIEAYRKAEELGHKPDLVFYTNVANVFFDLKDYTNVLLLTQKAKEISPYDIDIAYLEAYSYYNMNKLSEAREVAEAMLKINPENANMVYFIGMTYQKGSQMNKAENYFEKAIKMKPELEKLRTSNFNWDGESSNLQCIIYNV